MSLIIKAYIIYGLQVFF